MRLVRVGAIPPHHTVTGRGNALAVRGVDLLQQGASAAEGQPQECVKKIVKSTVSKTSF